MSERIFKTDKVQNIIGLENQRVNEKIDIFVDVTNNNNVWGIVYYTDYNDHKPQQKQEIVRFQDNQSMLDYVRENFNGYELNHPVDINKKQLFFHYVDYCDISYFYHDNKPNKNYVEFKLVEYINGNQVLSNIRLPKEYEEILVNVFKVNKRMPGVLSPLYYHDVDVYEERADYRRETMRSIKMSIGEFFALAGNSIRKIGHSKKLIKNIKIFVSVATLATLLGGGYKLVTDNEYNSEFMVQKNPISSVQDIGRYANKGRIGVIIDKLVDEKYDEVTKEEMDQALDYIKDLENGNYDSDASYTTFSYTEYFKDKIAFDDGVDYLNTSEMLYKIDSLYKKAIFVSDGKTLINPEYAKKYLDYVCSLTFMYDTYHSSRGITHFNDGNNQSIITPYATSGEIKAYDNLPAILKYIILNQGDTLLRRVDYKVDQKPLYYFKGTDKYELLSELSKKKDTVIDNMYYKCGYNNSQRL